MMYAGRYYDRDRRSDERILDDVHDRLTWHGHINAREIEVSVNDGVVTLRGTVDSRRERRMAEEVAENVMGVWDVNNEIKIRQVGRVRGCPPKSIPSPRWPVSAMG